MLRSCCSAPAWVGLPSTTELLVPTSNCVAEGTRGTDPKNSNSSGFSRGMDLRAAPGKWLHLSMSHPCAKTPWLAPGSLCSLGLFPIFLHYGRELQKLPGGGAGQPALGIPA